MDELLFAEGPYPELAEKVMLYGQFVGVWDIDNAVYGPEGERRNRREWHFGWVLGGRGVQDVLFESGAPGHRRGTTLRCYDERLDAWHVTWMGPSAGEFATMVGRPDGDDILQTGADELGLFRWRFCEIKPDSFRWQAHESTDGGQTWSLVQEMRALRRAAGE